MAANIDELTEGRKAERVPPPGAFFIDQPRGEQTNNGGDYAR
jgi:hypothetical protein